MTPPLRKLPTFSTQSVHLSPPSVSCLSSIKMRYFQDLKNLRSTTTDSALKKPRHPLS